MDPITVRQMNFAFPEEMDAVFIPGEPEESYALVAFSLLLPHLEPYLIRTMKAAKARLTDPQLIADLGKFNAQEGQHYRQHRRFNEAIRARGFPGLAKLEEELAADYERFTNERPLAFNLAYAEGFEAFTTATARFALEQRMLDRMPPAARDLFAWHLVEELEHRTVAFDVYEQVSGKYGYRLRIGMFAQWHLLRFVVRASRYMFEADPGLLARYGGEKAHERRMERLNGLFVKHLLPKAVATYAPWYTPHRIEMPEEARSLARRYSEMATSVVER
ncbi:MAG: metal-dependent hydrolase [Minicystis sp.]